MLIRAAPDYLALLPRHIEHLWCHPRSIKYRQCPEVADPLLDVQLPVRTERHETVKTDCASPKVSNAHTNTDDLTTPSLATALDPLSPIKPFCSHLQGLA